MTLDKIKSLGTKVFDTLDRFISRLMENKSDMGEICPECDGWGCAWYGPTIGHLSCTECGGAGYAEAS